MIWSLCNLPVDEHPNISTFYKCWRFEFSFLKIPAECCMERCDVCTSYNQAAAKVHEATRLNILNLKRGHLKIVKSKKVAIHELYLLAKAHPQNYTVICTDWSNPHLLPNLASPPKR